MSFNAPYGMGAGQGNMGDGYQRAFPGGWPQASNVNVTDLDSALKATRVLSNELGTLKGNWGKVCYQIAIEFDLIFSDSL